MNRRQFLERAKIGSIAAASIPVLGSALATPALANDDNGASHVRWDITSVNFPSPGTPTTLSPGGVAFASADASHVIKLTGSGTFVAPASGGTSAGVTGGGTWETLGPGGVSTGSGTYEVKELVSWQFALFQTGTFIDEIDDGKRADGNAILRIEYSDGSQGILGVGCDGPPNPAGIQEGVIATKGYFTYWTRGVPAPGVDANRTIFHVR